MILVIPLPNNILSTPSILGYEQNKSKLKFFLYQAKGFKNQKLRHIGKSPKGFDGLSI